MEHTVNVIIFLEIAWLPGQNVNMGVRDGLPRGRAVLHGEGKRLSAEAAAHDWRDVLGRGPQIGHLCGSEVLKARDYTPRDDENVPRDNRLVVDEAEREGG